MKYESQGVSISMSFCWINYHQTEQGRQRESSKKGRQFGCWAKWAGTVEALDHDPGLFSQRNTIGLLWPGRDLSWRGCGEKIEKFRGGEEGGSGPSGGSTAPYRTNMQPVFDDVWQCCTILKDNNWKNWSLNHPLVKIIADKNLARRPLFITM